MMDCDSYFVQTKEGISNRIPLAKRRVSCRNNDEEFVKSKQL